METNGAFLEDLSYEARRKAPEIHIRRYRTGSGT